MSNWEAGSEFHYGCLPGGAIAQHPWTDQQAVYGGSGRDVMRALIRMLREDGLKRLWLPSYFCHEVVQGIRQEISVETFSDLPLAGTSSPLADIPFTPGDSILVVNHWGVRIAAPLDEPQRHGLVVIEDHTHDPWSAWAYRSQADYCVASLRKCLPIPDGGVLWSPRGRRQPDNLPLTVQRQKASHDKLSGMVLKTAYLQGAFPDKEQYRALLELGEQQMADGAPSGISQLSRLLLNNLDVHGWRAKRLENLNHITTLLDATVLAPIPSSAVPRNHVPLGALLTLPSSEARDALRTHLIRERIYPAILWPISEQSPAFTDARLLSERTIFLHIDGRYDAPDIERIARAVRSWSNPN